ncbi:MAG: Fe-S-binding domain-containing protein, partial [Bacillota bacterium]
TWEITKQEVTCTFCDSGCKFDLNVKDGKVIGITAKAPASGRPLCLKGRLGLELRYVEEPLTPMLKKGGEFVPVSWAEALGLEEMLEKLRSVKN